MQPGITGHSTTKPPSSSGVKITGSSCTVAMAVVYQIPPRQGLPGLGGRQPGPLACTRVQVARRRTARPPHRGPWCGAVPPRRSGRWPPQAATQIARGAGAPLPFGDSLKKGGVQGGQSRREGRGGGNGGLGVHDANSGHRERSVRCIVNGSGRSEATLVVIC
jgi:hypothetical protein